MNDFKTNQFINEVLNSTNNLVNIDRNDVEDLFQNDEDVHTFEFLYPLIKETEWLC